MRLTFNKNSIFNEKINVQLVKSAFNKNSICNEIYLFEFHLQYGKNCNDLKNLLKRIKKYLKMSLKKHHTGR